MYIREAAEMLHRQPATLRQWERSGLLPKKLHPKRSDRGWRYWTATQIEEIRQWMRDQDLRPGKGLKHYHPTPEQIEAHIEGQRAPRKHRDELVAA